MWKCKDHGSEALSGCASVDCAGALDYVLAKRVEVEKLINSTLLLYPLLRQLCIDRTVTLDGMEYVGIASDGVELNLGTLGAEGAIENYLRSCPSPNNW